MPSTTKPTLASVFEPMSRGNTTSWQYAEEKQVSFYISHTGTVTNKPFYHSEGPTIIRRVTFLPDTAVTSASGEKWVVAFKTAGTNGLGTTELADYTTYASGSADINSALVALDAEVIWEPSGGYECVDGQVLYYDATETGTQVLAGLLIVSYVNII